MVGRSLQAEYYREPLQKPYRDEMALEVDGLSLAGAYRNVSFQLHRGEVLGIAGVIGSGREELARTFAGFAPHDGGRLGDPWARGDASHAGRSCGQRHWLHTA